MADGWDIAEALAAVAFAGEFPLPRERKNAAPQTPTRTTAAAARISGFFPPETFPESSGLSYAIRPWLMKSRVCTGPDEIADTGSRLVANGCFAACGSGSGGVQFATEVGAAESEWLYSLTGFSGIEAALLPGPQSGPDGTGGLGSAFELEAGALRLPNGVGNSSNAGVSDDASLASIGRGIDAGAGRTAAGLGISVRATGETVGPSGLETGTGGAGAGVGS